MVDPPSGARNGADLDAALESFDRFAASLVRLEPCSFEEVRRSVERFASAVERHLTDRRAAERRAGTGRRPAVPPGERLRFEHERFRVSVEQLRALLAVVEGDDHGGHRQALGQYGRIFAEALRLHRADERSSPRAAGPAGAPRPVPPGGSDKGK